MDILHLPDSYIYKTGERIVPGSVTEDALVEHCARYILAASFTNGKRVLNVAGGSGYGSIYLLQNAAEVFNVDISELSTAYGNKHYGAYNNHFLTMDAQNMSFPDNFFDVIVSFETIEHIPQPDSFLQECKRTLKKNGLLIVSTPNKIITSPGMDKPKNAFHNQEWTYEEFIEHGQKYFRLKEMYGQFKSPEQPPQPVTLKKWATGLVLKLMPGRLYRLIKKTILNYPDVDLLSIKIPSHYKPSKAKKEDFYLKSNEAYAIQIGIFEKHS